MSPKCPFFSYSRLRIAEIMGRIKRHWGSVEMMAKMGNPYARLRCEMGSSADGDRLSMISPDFEENPGQPLGLQNGPIFVS